MEGLVRAPASPDEARLGEAASAKAGLMPTARGSVVGLPRYRVSGTILSPERARDISVG
ncbi:MAG: hypothetical protein WEB30_17220 [Cyclobacteriaceae bacterium]